MEQGGSKRKKILGGVVLAVIFAGFLFFRFGGVDMINKKAVIVNSLNAFEKVVRLLPIKKDAKKEIETI